MRRVIAIVGALVLGSLSTAGAATYTEVGDAGASLATAQALPGGTTQVLGSIPGSGEDVFRFGWGGGAFYVNTVGTNWDSQLFLFDSAGRGVQGNDDGIQIAGPAYLQLSSLAAGTYYLGVSGFDHDPRDTNNNLMFQSYPYQPLYGPLDPSATLGSWAGNGAGGQYVINFRQTTGQGEQGQENPTGGGNTVPEPGTMVLLGTGLLGIVGLARKTRKA